MKTLYLIRGLSGSGKTTLANIIWDAMAWRNLCEGRKYNHNFATSISADDFFTDNEGKYHFDPKQLSDAHNYALERVHHAMENDVQSIIVHNTFSQQWEAQKYIDKANEYGYTVSIIECQNKFDNVHDVPPHVVQNMANRWENIST
jgi:predicted ABC-type ATPase